MAAPTDWSAIELCIDADLREFETDVLQWTGAESSAAKWRRKAKDLIDARLRLRFKQVEIDTDVDDVLDLIGNPEVLKDAACYRTLHLLANDISTAPGDLYAEKAAMYYGLFKEEIEIAVSMLHLDLDESGVIDDSEKYTGAQYTGVRLKMGG